MRKQPSLRWSRTKVERTSRTVEMLVELARMDQEERKVEHAVRHLELARAALGQL